MIHPPDRRLAIVGVPVDPATFESMLARIETWIGQRDRVHQICTVSPEFVMIAQDNPDFMRALQQADLCVADGVGLLLAARLLGQRLPERVTGSDGVPLIARRAAERGWKLFLLGAAPGVAERAAARLRADNPGLVIAGTYAGSPDPAEEEEIIARVNVSGADILFVAYGAPQQDLWIARNRDRLAVAVAMGVGGTFDFIAGVVPRAPRWMRRTGLEWLYRLYRQPWRWRRMLRLPRFMLAVLTRREQPLPRAEGGNRS
ncbi:MAG: WecB/TagA/CpsF family glycosyltransferase [Aggregatilineaceae bacterium]